MPGSTTRRRIVAAILGAARALDARGCRRRASAAVNGQLKQLRRNAGLPGTRGGGVRQPRIDPDDQRRQAGAVARTACDLYVPDRGTGSGRGLRSQPDDRDAPHRTRVLFVRRRSPGANPRAPSSARHRCRTTTAAAGDGDGKSLYVVGQPTARRRASCTSRWRPTARPSLRRLLNGNGTTGCSNMPMLQHLEPDVGGDQPDNDLGLRRHRKRHGRRLQSQPDDGGAEPSRALGRREVHHNPSPDANDCSVVSQFSTITDLAVTPDGKQVLVACPIAASLVSSTR